MALVCILVAAPSVYDRTLKLSNGSGRIGEAGVLAALSTLIAVLSVGVVRRWRWTFWLILAAFVAGVLRVPAAILEISGVISTRDPTWYIVFQGVLGVVLFMIGLALWAGYRRASV
jgi:hypothetical protein